MCHVFERKRFKKKLRKTKRKKNLVIRREMMKEILKTKKNIKKRKGFLRKAQERYQDTENIV